LDDFYVKKIGEKMRQKPIFCKSKNRRDVVERKSDEGGHFLEKFIFYSLRLGDLLFRWREI
jgi:hypothetical protein